ncbi:hypothetical protein HB770_11750 [Rhizobium leguminosarum bv. viciae]|uniref:Transmembrane protein n=1 Tax=Rhizobium leguminosarum bv. viciae TaxID=387 RepID=A0A7G6RJG5_RHILV|nr:hypothetical protein HB770_11750 [Rhizobium leguminosarum bv. viciae]
MGNIGYFIATASAIVILNIVASFMAQHIHPTLMSDGIGRRISYRFVFVSCFLVLIGLATIALLVLDGLGFRL